MKIKGIIFDFDGTILDTESPELHAWLHLYEEFGVIFPIAKHKQNIGAFNIDDEITHHLLANMKATNLSSLSILKKHHELKHTFLEQEEILPGVHDYLYFAKENGLKLGLASSASSEWITPNVDRLNIRNYFDSILTADNVDNIKPHPDLYLLSLSQLGINSYGVIAFEDSPNGVKASKSANIFTIAVPNKVTKDFNFDEADMRLDSLSEIPPEELLMKIEKYY